MAVIHKINIDLISLGIRYNENFNFVPYKLQPNVFDKLFFNFCINDKYYYCSEIQLSATFSDKDVGQVQIFCDRVLRALYNFKISPTLFTELVIVDEQNFSYCNFDFEANNDNWIQRPWGPFEE